MSAATVSIDRSAMPTAPAALAITDDGATYRLTDRGLARPAIGWRLTAMPESSDIHGTEYIAAVKEQTSLPLEIMVTAASSSALNTACVALEAALSQFTYATTVTVDGVAKVWSCSPASWSTGLTDAGEVAAHLCTYAVTIPVHPIAS